MIIVTVETFRKRSKEEHLFKIEIFCNIIHIFTITFGQLNVKNMNFFKKKKSLLTPNL